MLVMFYDFLDSCYHCVAISAINSYKKDAIIEKVVMCATRDERNRRPT